MPHLALSGHLYTQKNLSCKIPAVVCSLTVVLTVLKDPLWSKVHFLKEVKAFLQDERNVQNFLEQKYNSFCVLLAVSPAALRREYQ